jgi:UDP-glucose 4-epimerase
MARSALTGASVLVVGGAGFVGSNLVLRLLEDEPKALYVVDNLLSSEIENVPDRPKVHVILGSIADDRILSGLPRDLDYVFHLACYHGNQSSIADPVADHANNTITSLKLFDKVKDISALKKVVYAAAGCAVAEKTFADAAPTAEDAPVSLFHDSPYSISKLVGEMYGNYFFLQHRLPIVKARFQNVYGPREILGAGSWRGTPHTVWRNVIPTFVWKALHKEALPLDNGGNASRDFVFVGDLVEGLRLAALNGAPGEVYNLASGVETRIFDLANFINELTGNETPNELKPPRNWDRSGMRFGSVEKSKRELKFETKIGIREGLEKTIAWTHDNRALIDRCVNRHRYFLSHPGAGRWSNAS